MDFIISLWNVFLQLIKNFRIADALDILLVTFVIYNAIKLVRETRAGQLVRGILILLVVWILSYWLNLFLIRSIINYLFQFAFIAVLIVFQPEIRRALEQIGRSGIRAGKGWNFGLNFVSSEEEERLQKSRKAVNAVVDAAVQMSRQKTGALIVFELKTKLGDIIDTGTIVEAMPSAQILCNIFFNKAPLHDGAVIIRDGMVYAAGCILPLTKNDNVSIELGTRHRAAIGMSENSDAVIVVVSEETGQISVVTNGTITRNYTRETLNSELENLVLSQNAESDEKKQNWISSFRRTKKQ
ncbi:MAG: Diadenylate cyclase [Oscillospiraceae bacterium]|jgi:diadenylate cyclase